MECRLGFGSSSLGRVESLNLKPLEVVRSSTQSIRYEVNRLVLAG